MEASPGLTARRLGDLDDGPLRAVVAARWISARSGIQASEPAGLASEPEAIAACGVARA